MRRLDHLRHVPQLDLFRPDTPKLEWRQLPAEARGKAASPDSAHAPRTPAREARRRAGRRARR